MIQSDKINSIDVIAEKTYTRRYPTVLRIYFPKNPFNLALVGFDKAGLQPKGAVRLTWFGSLSRCARLAWPGGARSSLTIPQWKVRDITRDLNKSISHASRYLYHRSRHSRFTPSNVRARGFGALPRSESNVETPNVLNISYSRRADLLLLRRWWLMATLFIEHAHPVNQNNSPKMLSIMSILRL